MFKILLLSLLVLTIAVKSSASIDHDGYHREILDNQINQDPSLDTFWFETLLKKVQEMLKGLSGKMFPLIQQLIVDPNDYESVLRMIKDILWELFNQVKRDANEAMHARFKRSFFKEDFDKQESALNRYLMKLQEVFAHGIRVSNNGEDVFKQESLTDVYYNWFKLKHYFSNPRKLVGMIFSDDSDGDIDWKCELNKGEKSYTFFLNANRFFLLPKMLKTNKIVHRIPLSCNIGLLKNNLTFKSFGFNVQFDESFPPLIIGDIDDQAFQRHFTMKMHNDDLNLYGFDFIVRPLKAKSISKENGKEKLVVFDCGLFPKLELFWKNLAISFHQMTLNATLDRKFLKDAYGLVVVAINYTDPTLGAIIINTDYEFQYNHSNELTNDEIINLFYNYKPIQSREYGNITLSKFHLSPYHIRFPTQMEASFSNDDDRNSKLTITFDLHDAKSVAFRVKREGADVGNNFDSRVVWKKDSMLYRTFHYLAGFF